MDSEEWQWALELMEEMLNAQLLLDVVTLGAALSACANGMAWELALAINLQAKSLKYLYFNRK